MQDLVASPLCKGSDLLVYRPPLQYFIDKIEANEYFSFTRQMHGLWDAVIAAWLIQPELRRLRFYDKAYVRDLANSMSKAKKEIEGLFYEPEFYVELIEILQRLDHEDSSMYFGVSDTYFFPESPPPYSTYSFALPNKCFFKHTSAKGHLKYYKVRFADRQSVIKMILPKSSPLFDAMIWKLYSYRDEIWNLFESIKDHPVVLVGPAHYKSFNLMVGISNYHHIEIHGTKASSERSDILEKITMMHESLLSGSKPPVYFFVGGSLSVYWVYHLHKRLERKFLIDVGQAFNFLFESKIALLHKEFGYSQKGEKGRRFYNTKKLYGDRPFHSSMVIADNVVKFELNLKFKDYWLQWVESNINRYLINTLRLRRFMFITKHNIYNFFKGG